MDCRRSCEEEDVVGVCSAIGSALVSIRLASRIKEGRPKGERDQVECTGLAGQTSDAGWTSF